MKSEVTGGGEEQQDDGGDDTGLVKSKTVRWWVMVWIKGAEREKRKEKREGLTVANTPFTSNNAGF
jgi:hypothetical protein